MPREVPPVVESAATGNRPAEENAAIPEKGRVLLLDDEFEFRELIRGFLAESGYSVVAVENGVDGVREVLAGDFSLILCDMRMPKVSGEVFYRAVERIRPHLCGRFVFMSGQGGDAETTQFIDSVSGFLLRKPFPLNDLLDWIAVAEVCGAHGKPVEGAAKKDAPAPISPVASRVATSEPAEAAAPSPAHVPAPAQAQPVPVPVLEALPDGAPPPPDRFLRAMAFAVPLLVICLIAGLWNRYWDARERFDAASAERLALEVEWSAVSPDLQNANAVRAMIESARSQLAYIAAEREKPRWTPALRSIVAAGDKGIQILRFRSRGETSDAQACEMRVSGIASGSEPRHVADQYRKAVETDLARTAAGRPVVVRFEQLGQRRANFVMFVSLGSIEPAVPIGREAQ
jgi:CheY-like chemotaxis protein